MVWIGVGGYLILREHKIDFLVIGDEDVEDEEVGVGIELLHLG
jgi:hypothetical protein